MNNLSKTFCPLPWIHLATRPNGDVRVCCTANASGALKDEDIKDAGLIKNNDGEYYNLSKNSVEEIWNSDFMKDVRLKMLSNQIPDSCRKCFEEESLNIKSKRQWETEVWQQRIDIKELVEQTQDDGSLEVSIPYFDLRLGNLCQLKCVMCNPHDSSSWIKEWKIQFPLYEDKFLKEDQFWAPSVHDYNWYKKNNFLNFLESQAPNIKEIYFAGGEPLLIPEHYSILKNMIKHGYAQNCVLRYNSNGLEISSELINIWKEFKSVKFNFSIDAYAEKNEYIRYPSKWKNIEESLKLLDNTPDNIIVNIACAVQALNVLYLDEFAIWKRNQNFKKINVINGGVFGMHLVYFPSFLNIRVLPRDVKIIAKNRILNFLELMKNDALFNDSELGKSRWLGMIDYMMAEDWENRMPSLINYLNVTDKQRNLNFRTIFPDLKGI